MERTRSSNPHFSTHRPFLRPTNTSEPTNVPRNLRNFIYDRVLSVVFVRATERRVRGTRSLQLVGSAKNRRTQTVPPGHFDGISGARPRTRSRSSFVRIADRAGVAGAKTVVVGEKVMSWGRCAGVSSFSDFSLADGARCPVVF